MPSRGKPKGDTLVATSGDDVLVGTRGSDWLEGGAGNDSMTGNGGADTFVFRANGGSDVVTDFNASQGDRVMLDSQAGIYDGQLGGFLGSLHDGQQIYNSRGTLVATVSLVDQNGDGVGDTQFAFESGATLTLLGVDPSNLSSGMLFGG
jgi:Ca2+-binding RTX toxin-like protein